MHKLRLAHEVKGWWICLVHLHGVKLAMRLNHIDIAVNDVSAARAFLETYFDLHCIAERGTVAIMRDDAGVIVALSNFGHAKEVTYPKEFHVGFFQNTSQKYLKFQLLRAACSNFCVGYPRMALVPPVLRST
jgi:hypothetical protein